MIVELYLASATAVFLTRLPEVEFDQYTLGALAGVALLWPIWSVRMLLTRFEHGQGPVTMHIGRKGKER